MKLKTPDGHIEYWYEYGIDFRRRVLRITEDIDECTADLAISGLLALDDSDGPILIRMSTYGGEGPPGMALYDTICAMKNKKTQPSLL